MYSYMSAMLYIIVDCCLIVCKLLIPILSAINGKCLLPVRFVCVVECLSNRNFDRYVSRAKYRAEENYLASRRFVCPSRMSV